MEMRERCDHPPYKDMWNTKTQRKSKAISYVKSQAKEKGRTLMVKCEMSGSDDNIEMKRS